MPHPTNEVLATKLDSLCEKFDIGMLHLKDSTKRIESHVKETNGHVARNTKFRNEYEKVIDEHLDESKSEKNNKIKRYSDLAWKVGVAAGGAALGVSQFL